MGSKKMGAQKPICAHCSKQSGKIQLYWSSRNMINELMKTYYCNACAKIIVPGQDPIRETPRLPKRRDSYEH